MTSGSVVVVTGTCVVGTVWADVNLPHDANNAHTANKTAPLNDFCRVIGVKVEDRTK